MYKDILTCRLPFVDIQPSLALAKDVWLTGCNGGGSAAQQPTFASVRDVDEVARSAMAWLHAPPLLQPRSGCAAVATTAGVRGITGAATGEICTAVDGRNTGRGVCSTSDAHGPRAAYGKHRRNSRRGR